MSKLPPTQFYQTLTTWIEDAQTSEHLPEYKVEKNCDEVSCYIPSENGMRFEVNVKFNNTDKCLASILTIDGQEVRSQVFVHLYLL
jgi:hypothetical protein